MPNIGKFFYYKFYLIKRQIMQQINFNNPQYKYSFKKQKSDEEKYKTKQNFLSSLLSCALVITDYYMVANIPPKVSKSIIDKMVNINQSLSCSQVKSFEEAFDKAFKKSKLNEFGVSIFKCNDFKKDTYNIKEHIKKNITPKWLNKYSLETYFNIVSEHMKTNNSCYTFFDKTIYSSKNTRLSLFHEMGHAYNHNKTVFARGLQKVRELHQILILPLTVISLCLPMYKEGNQPKENNSKLNTFLLKAQNSFVKFSPLILFSSFLPMLVEEGLASLQGQKFAKKVLNKNIYNKVKLINFLGFLTYLFFASFSSLVLWSALKIKNSFLNKQLNKT